MKILLVDDSAFMRNILKDIIIQSTWKDAIIVEAGDGEEGLAKFTTEKPDLVLLDIVMPKKDGIQLLKEISTASPSVIMVSSVGQESVIAEAKKMGAKDYIVKPFEAQQVIETLNRLTLPA